MTDQVGTGVEVLSQVHLVNIVQLMGWSKDCMAPCLVYAFLEGDSLKDRLACRGSGALVQLTADERILCDVAQSLTSALLCCLTLHGVCPTCNRRCVSFTVTSRAPTCCWTEVDSAALKTLASLYHLTTTTQASHPRTSWAHRCTWHRSIKTAICRRKWTRLLSGVCFRVGCPRDADWICSVLTGSR